MFNYILIKLNKISIILHKLLVLHYHEKNVLISGGLDLLGVTL
jgi:hypothetical protein